MPSARLQEHVDMDGTRADRQRRKAAGAASLRRMLQSAEAVERRLSPVPHQRLQKQRAMDSLPAT